EARGRAAGEGEREGLRVTGGSLEVVSPDHLFIEQNVASKRMRVLAADKHGTFAHRYGFFKGLWRLPGPGHAEDIPCRADSPDRGEHIKTDALVLIFHRQPLGEAL